MRRYDWLVGIDLAPSSRGVLRYADWLHRQGAVEHQLHGMYSVANAVPDGTLQLVHESETLESFVTSRECRDAFTTLRAVSGAADRMLARRATEVGADGILVGRAAATDERAFVSLGPIPRRLLRRAPVPVIVVPPDLGPSTFSGGPVVIAVTPSGDSVGALRFGLTFAETHGWDVRIVHVLPRGSTTAPREPGADAGEIQPTPSTTESRDKVERWCRAEGMLNPRCDVFHGRIEPTLLDLAKQVDASMIVCGSRRLSLLERLLSSSVGSGVAAHADRPVAVVPPEPALVSPRS